MCFGGGGSPATIYAPDTGKYDKQFELQQAAIEQSMNNNTKLVQAQLDDALRRKQQVLEASVDIKKELADKTSTQVQRMTQLIGTPPPEKSAAAPVVGSNREPGKKKGKGALRIEQGSAVASTGQGAGLNIT